MLSESSAAVVTATLPAVQAHGEAITGRFYQRMFDAHPELLDVFNRGNQATGQQKAALAAAVVAYAEHLTGDGRVPWGPILDRIAHKHASLGITATQYTIVGRHLLAAVGEVLGDAVTAEVAAAWDEVYWLLACELIAQEARLYTLAGVAEDGAVWRDWRVVARTRETADVVSFTLVPADGAPRPRSRRGSTSRWRSTWTAVGGSRSGSTASPAGRALPTGGSPSSAYAAPVTRRTAWSPRTCTSGWPRATHCG